MRRGVKILVGEQLREELKHFQTLFGAERGLNGHLERISHLHISLACCTSLFGTFRLWETHRPRGSLLGCSASGAGISACVSCSWVLFCPRSRSLGDLMARKNAHSKLFNKAIKKGRTPRPQGAPVRNPGLRSAWSLPLSPATPSLALHANQQSLLCQTGGKYGLPTVVKFTSPWLRMTPSDS